MAASVLSSTNRNYHVRSASFPSRSHPIREKVEENLTQLRQWEESSPSTSSSSLCSGLSGLSELYQSVDDLLQLPQTRQALLDCKRKKLIDEALDGSLRLLDACGIARDVMMQVTDAVKDLQLALRRRVATKAELEKDISIYLSLTKKIKQNACACVKALETEKFDFSTLSDGSQHFLEVMTLLSKARSFAGNILKQLLCFISMTKPRCMKRSYVLKWIVGSSGRLQVACEKEEEEQKMNAVERLHASLSVLCSRKTEQNGKQLRDAQEQLNALIEGIQGPHVGLDLLQRRFIQTRVSLLNILSQ
ncbi:hypothetical protein H6P81_019001 [Aristolochia fimbriata]|uniref:Uncharacterized protein n=1 Tax=Aristolochia fimbriata TaxID=158543 RepID=A0AAV7E5N3_ARIFI|nr:hypothetical protein H6P81_019001 [Aristolochia fimbriata]